ncbi:MAG: efflux RND transporter periplasmic adaptor subunit [Chloroflexi bacterium]|nr:efflux RND transporter periplasmic adaptor subunit [Chloroflexota bacterium]
MDVERKSKKSRGKRWVLFAGMAVVVVGIAGIFVYSRLQASNSSATTYTTQAVTQGDLTNTVSGTGNVYTRQSVTLSWETSGIVSQVNVTKGQQVTAGTVLAELDQSSLPVSNLSAATDLASAQQALDDLLNSGTARANAELALIQAEQNLQSAQESALSKLYQRASQTTIDSTNANLIQAQDALKKATQAYNQVKSGDTSSMQYALALSNYAAAQQKYDQAQANLAYVTGLPDALSVQETNAELAVAQATYNDAKRAWERVKDGPNQDDVAAAEAKVAAAQAVLDEAKITAPIAGTVTEIRSQVGDLVSPSATAFEIDDMSHLYIDLSISEVDIDQVEVGQPAAITFDAISDKTYTGKVTDIGMIGSSSSGAVNYTVTVEIDSPDAQIKPGMTATADITVMEKSGVLLVPSSAIRTLNNQNVVYVLQNGTLPLRVVPITTGDSSTTSTVVTSGNLQVGELIVINPPSTTTSTTTTSTRQGGLLGGLFGGLFGGSSGGGAPGGGGGVPPDVGVPGGPGSSPSGSSGSSGSSSSSQSGSQSK